LGDALRGTLPEEERITWPVDEIGAPRYHSYLLGTGERLVRREPGRVRAFVAATARGFAAAATEQDRTLALLEGVIPYFSRPLIARSPALIAPTWTDAKGRWGVIDDMRMGPYAHWLAGHGAVAHAEGWERSFTNDFANDLLGAGVH
jgi:NitT/TauT family transport system substrate-binding protein